MFSVVYCVIMHEALTWGCVFCQPPTPEQMEADIKIEAIKKEISDLVAEVRCQQYLI